MLYLIILIEGYVVLATELLAIRQTIPHVGSGTDTVSIIIAAVLMPLACGYVAGGHFVPGFYFGRFMSCRRKLVFNIVVAAIILLFGQSYIFISIFFQTLYETGIANRLVQTALYCVVFLAVPVYLLGQTIPLISHYFTREKLARVTGRILFFSTLGSFLGAVFSTLILMSILGVHHTATLNFVLLSILVVFLSRDKLSKSVLVMFAVTLLALILNSNDMMLNFGIVKNNEYQTIIVKKGADGKRHLFLNNNPSSSYDDQGNKYPYIEFAEQVAILPIDTALPSRDVLVIGAGGFTFGHEDTHNNYTYLDIDEDLKDVAETYILKAKLKPNQKFFPIPGRAFLAEHKEKYDVIFIDAYLGGHSFPEHLGTREFFTQVKEHLKQDGILIANFILSPTFRDPFSKALDDTFRSVFLRYSRQIVPADRYHAWRKNPNLLANVMYVYRHDEEETPQKVYTDDKNTIFYDKPKRLR